MMISRTFIHGVGDDDVHRGGGDCFHSDGDDAHGVGDDVQC